MIKLILVSSIAGIISGLGVGGGSIFILLTTILGIFEHKEAQGYNLIMFIAVGIFATISNLKNKNIDKKILKKVVIPVCIGSVIGTMFVKKIEENTLKNIFYTFMIFIGSFEIISSLKNIITAKNNTERS